MQNESYVYLRRVRIARQSVRRPLIDRVRRQNVTGTRRAVDSTFCRGGRTSSALSRLHPPLVDSSPYPRFWTTVYAVHGLITLTRTSVIIGLVKRTTLRFPVEFHFVGTTRARLRHSHGHRGLCRFRRVPAIRPDCLTTTTQLTNTMDARTVTVWLSLALFYTTARVSAFYLPGLAPVNYCKEPGPSCTVSETR